MKNTVIFFSAIIATFFSFIACNKVNATNGGGEKLTKAPFVIKVAYSSTKTVLGSDGFSPKFVENDEIKVFGKDKEVGTYKVSMVDGVAAITIPSEDLENVDEKHMTLVYPSSRGNIYSDPFFGTKVISTIPSYQDGKFENANICLARDVDFSSGRAVFTPESALFKFDLSEHPEINTITLIGDKPIHDEDPVNKIYTTTVTLSSDVADRVYYVAVSAVSGVTLLISDGSRKLIISGLNINNFLYNIDMEKNWEKQ